MLGEYGLKIWSTAHQKKRLIASKNGGLNAFSVMFANGADERNIDQRGKNVLSEEDSHIIAEIFANQIFKHEPNQKHVNA